MRCGKRCYITRKLAKKAMKKINLVSIKKHRSIYFCEDCQHYHLTSMSKEKSINFNHKNN